MKIIDFEKMRPCLRRCFSPKDGVENTVMSDASNYELGAFLLQQESEHWRLIYIGSKKINNAEIKYVAVPFSVLTSRHN